MEHKTYGSSRGTFSSLKEELPAGYPSLDAIRELLHSSCVESSKQVEIGLPPLLQDSKVLLYGRHTIADAFLISYLIGPDGALDVFDVDQEGAETGRTLIDFHTDKFGFVSPNIRFHTGIFSEFCKQTEKSFDLFLASTLFCLGPEKQTVLNEAASLLKTGGECFLRETFSSRRLEETMDDTEALWGEGLSGTMEWDDFIVSAIGAGFCQPRMVSSTPMEISSPWLLGRLGKTKLASVIFRMFKLPDELDSEDYYIVTYEGGVPGFEEDLPFDDTFSFKKDELVSTGTSLGIILQNSRFQKFFNFQTFKRKMDGSVVVIAPDARKSDAAFPHISDDDDNDYEVESEQKRDEQEQ